jgi:lipopolysaccharide export system permease protein
LLTSVKDQRPEMIIKEGIFSNDIDGYSIKVKARDPKTKALLDIMIYDHTEKKGNINVTLADSGYLNMSDDKQFMILKLFNGESYTDTKVGDRKANETYPFRREKFDHQEVVIGVKDFELKRADEKYWKDNYKMLHNNQLASVIDSLKIKYFEKEQQVAVGMKYNELLEARVLNHYSHDSLLFDAFLMSPMSVPFDSVYQTLDKSLRSSVLDIAQQVAQQNQRVILQFQPDMYNRMVWLNKHIVEWHKKYNLSLACLLFFFIGAPLGAIIRKGGFGMPVVVSILLFISYYLFSVIGEKVAREGVWKIDMVLWVPSVVYLLIGILLTHQAVTDSLLMNKETYNRLVKMINIFSYLVPAKIKKDKEKDEDTVLNQ